jgi:undecaprenyl-diphosphatase
MSDTSLFLLINGWAGKTPFVDELFKGISNDYFTFIFSCLVLVWLWFSTRDPDKRQQTQKAVLTALISIGMVSIMMGIINQHYFRERPFDVLPQGSINLIFYRPHDSSFPSNFAAVIFSLAIPMFIKNKSWGSLLLALAIVASFGRIFMGVHYPLDVLAGAFLGLLAYFVATGITRVLQFPLSWVFGFLQRIYLA